MIKYLNSSMWMEYVADAVFYIGARSKEVICILAEDESPAIKYNKKGCIDISEWNIGQGPAFGIANFNNFHSVAIRVLRFTPSSQLYFPNVNSKERVKFIDELGYYFAGRGIPHYVTATSSGVKGGVETVHKAYNPKISLSFEIQTRALRKTVLAQTN